MFAMSYWVTGMRTVQMLSEAQLIVSIRMAGMMGLAPLPEGETTRIVAEKTRAFTQAGIAAGKAVALGRSPVAIARAALAPVARQTRANARRLTKL